VALEGGVSPTGPAREVLLNVTALVYWGRALSVGPACL